MDMLTRLRAPGFLRNVLVMVSGTLAGQAVMMLALPVLTHLYDPAAFGYLGIYMSLTSFLLVPICARLEIAIPIPEEDSDAINLTVLSILVATVASAVLGLIALLLPDQIIAVIDQPEFRPYLWMVPLGVWLGGLYAALQMWSVRRKRFGDVAKTQFVRATGSSGVQIGVGLWSPIPFGLIFGHFLYMGLGSVRLAGLFWRHDRDQLRHVSRSAMQRNLYTQRRFPLYSVPESLLNSASVYLPLLMIGAVLGPAQAGLLLLAQRVGSVPVGLLGSNMSRVYLAEATEKRLAGDLGPFTRQIMAGLFKVGALPFAVLGVSAPFLFPLVFGADWIRAGEMMAWITPALFMQFLVVPVSTILHATDNQFRAFALQLSGFVLTIGSIWGATHLAPAYVFEAFAIGSFVHSSVYFSLIYRLSKQYDQEVFA